MDVDLNKTPWLHWHLKVAGVLQGRGEQTKAGDDYPARIYVVKKSGLFGWRSRAVNYVWSSYQPVGSQWRNAYTDSAAMLAVNTGGAQAGQWLWNARHVKNDFKSLLGEDVSRIQVVAIMTDTDNTGEVADAWYGEIYFSDKPEPAEGR